jgi:hypothetical protein
VFLNILFVANKNFVLKGVVALKRLRITGVGRGILQVFRLMYGQGFKFKFTQGANERRNAGHLELFS